MAERVLEHTRIVFDVTNNVKCLANFIMKQQQQQHRKAQRMATPNNRNPEIDTTLSTLPESKRRRHLTNGTTVRRMKTICAPRTSKAPPVEATETPDELAATDRRTEKSIEKP